MRAGDARSRRAQHAMRRARCAGAEASRRYVGIGATILCEADIASAYKSARQQQCSGEECEKREVRYIYEEKRAGAKERLQRGKQHPPLCALGTRAPT